MYNQNVTDGNARVPLRNELEVRTTTNARWSAIVAGGFVTAALWSVLHLLGIGVGLTAIDPDHAGSLDALGVGVGVWSLIAPILALFGGGVVVSRLAPTPNRVNRMLHGALVWAVSALVSLAVIYAVATSVVQGVASAGGTVAAATGVAIGSVDRDTLGELGIDAKALLAPINERLRGEGKPAVTPEAIERAARAALLTTARTGNLERSTLVQSLAQNTALSPRDAEEIATAVESRWRAFAARAQHATLQVAETAGKALTGLAVALLLGLGAAMGGALVTGRYDRRRSPQETIIRRGEPEVSML